MDTKALRQKILDLAIRGKLVPQDPNDEPASVLLERIRAEKQQMVKDGKLKPKDIKNDTVIFKGDDNLHYEQYADGTVKCIEDEIPFDVPDNWEWCRLQTICTKEIKRGKAPKYEEKSSVIVFAQKCNTKSGFIDISKAKFLAQNTLKKYADEDFLYYNDIIINSTGTGTLGRVGIYKKEDDIYSIKIVPDSHITTVRTIPSEINAQYIYYFLKFNQLYFENSGVGSTNQKELKPEVISTFLIAIPPLNEQNAIIDKVNMVNKHLSNLDNEKEQLKELISSTKFKILDLAIRGKLVPQDQNDEPASVLLERIRAEKEELIKQGKIKRDKKESVIFKGDDNSYYEKIGNDITCINDEIPFETPINWQWVRLGSTVGIERGGSPRPIKSYITTDSNGINWIKIGDVDKDGKYITNTKEKIKPTGLKKSREVYPGDFLLTNSMSFGRPYISKIYGCVHDGWLVLRNPDVVFDINFLYYLLSSNYLYNQFLTKASGSTVDNLNIDKVSSALICLPPLKEQTMIVHQIEKLMKLIQQFEELL